MACRFSFMWKGGGKAGEGPDYPGTMVCRDDEWDILGRGSKVAESRAVQCIGWLDTGGDWW